MKIDRPENFAAATAMARPPQSGFTFPSIGGRQKERRGQKKSVFLLSTFSVSHRAFHGMRDDCPEPPSGSMGLSLICQNSQLD
jgi:hypothetical protein